MVKVTPRSLADWTPEDGVVDAWLQEWAAVAWVPEYTWGGVETSLGGRRIVRWAMIAATPQVELEPVDR